MGYGERQQAADSGQPSEKRRQKTEDRSQRVDCGLRIANFKKTENRNSTVGAAFSRDFYALNGFNDLTNERIF
jgi:hypothetical protein